MEFTEILRAWLTLSAFQLFVWSYGTQTFAGGKAGVSASHLESVPCRYTLPLSALEQDTPVGKLPVYSKAMSVGQGHLRRHFLINMAQLCLFLHLFFFFFQSQLRCSWITDVLRIPNRVLRTRLSLQYITVPKSTRYIAKQT